MRHWGLGPQHVDFSGHNLTASLGGIYFPHPTYFSLGHMTCFGKWNVARNDIFQFQDNTLRDVTGFYLSLLIL